MNPFFFEGTNKEMVMDITEVKNTTLNDVLNQGFCFVTVNDSEYENCYQLRIEKAAGEVKGFSVMCFLDKRSSMQADYLGEKNKRIADFINAIGAMEIIDQNGGVK